MKIAPVKEGQRIELIQMGNDPDPIPSGTQGVVTSVCPFPGANEFQISVKWDNGRTLSLCYPEDKFRIL